MRFRSTLLYALTAFIGGSAQAQVTNGATPISAACTWRNDDALSRVAHGQSMEAENILSVALANGGRLDHVCAGLTMTNIAALLLVSGRLAEAEVMAERSVHTLEESFPPDDPALLRPLQILAAVQFERGKIARARETFKRMQSNRTRRPEDLALVNAMAASLLKAQGRWPEAESQYAAAIHAMKEAGRGDSADAGALLNGLGAIYIEEHRMDAARQTLNEALAVFERAPDADPWDRIKLLHTRGALCARQGEWREAEQDLANALSIADRESRVEPAALRSLLIDYAAVLRKNHRRQEARSIETRIAALGRALENREVVDVTDLLARSKKR
jgi:tetratricopeptide (TPR) repeat protein